VEACPLCEGRDARPLFEKAGYAYVRCVSCATVRALAHPDPEAASLEHGESVAAEEAKAFHPRKQAKYAALLRRLEPRRRTGRLLDVGCSVGGFLAAARARGWRAIGVETEPAATRAASARGLEVSRARAGALPFAGKSFDVVRMNAVLEHLLDPRIAIAEAARVVRAGGAVLALTLSADSWTLRRLGSRWRYLGMGGHVLVFSRRALLRAFEEAGLRVLRVRTAGVRLADRARGATRLAERILDGLARGAGTGHRIAVEAERPPPG